MSKSDQVETYEGFLTASQVAALLGVSTRTIHNWAAAGKFPKPRRLSTHLVRWDARVIADYLASQT